MYRGTIIEESLKDRSVLDGVRIVSGEIEDVTTSHNTPWLRQWTIDEVEIEDMAIKGFTRRLQAAMETEHPSWYADFKGEQDHYIVFPGKIFYIDQRRNDSYNDAVTYGVSLGIPKRQLDFSQKVS
jgi:hypothetical protein